MSNYIFYNNLNHFHDNEKKGITFVRQYLNNLHLYSPKIVSLDLKGEHDIDLDYLVDIEDYLPCSLKDLGYEGKFFDLNGDGGNLKGDQKEFPKSISTLKIYVKENKEATKFTSSYTFKGIKSLSIFDNNVEIPIPASIGKL